MPKPAKKARPISKAVCDPDLPLQHRFEMIRMLVTDPTERDVREMEKIFETLSKSSGESLYAEKLEKLAELIRLMEEGPLRPAVFVRMLEASGTQPPLAQVLLEDGATAYIPVPDEQTAAALTVGGCVLLDRGGQAVLRPGPELPKVGEEAKLERVLTEGRVEVSLRGDERAVFHVAGPLGGKIESGEVTPGAVLVVNQRQSFANDALPPADGLAHYIHLLREPVPDVVAARDMGDPPRVIGQVAGHLRIEMTRPDILRAFRLPRPCMHLLVGPAGVGKTMAVLAIWNAMYQLMSEVTGVPVDELPPRVIKFKTSRILDPYLGVSDKNLDRFFDELEQLADETFVTPDGREIRLPVLVVLEEIDGIATQRGQDHNGIYDRILTTLLQRLDPIRPELRDKLIVFLGSSNEPGQIDAAVLRRIGGTIHKFGRLGRRGFGAVLDKHLRGLPLHYGNGNLTAGDRERAMVSELAAWLYCRNGSDAGIVELNYVGAATTETRYRRDFLTGALVGRAVEQACRTAAAAEAENGGDRGGLTLELLAGAFDGQIRSVAEQVDERNVHRFLEIPDAVRVASVRRLAPPAGHLIELQNR